MRWHIEFAPNLAHLHPLDLALGLAVALIVVWVWERGKR